MLLVDVGAIKRKQIGSLTQVLLMTESEVTEDELRARSGVVSQRVGPPVTSHGWYRVPDGWVGTFNHHKDFAAMTRWLEEFATWEVQGTLGRQPAAKAMPWRGSTPLVAGHVYLSTEDVSEMGLEWEDMIFRWGVTDRADSVKAGRRILDWIDQPAPVNRHVGWSLGSLIPYTSISPESLMDLQPALGQVTVGTVTKKPFTSRVAHLMPHGSITVQHGDSSWSWQDQAAAVREFLLSDLPPIAQASMQLSQPAAISGSAWPYVDAAFVILNAHLLPEYVPDAHGFQILTDAHLSHARDLSAWTITPLGHGRHLVEAPDLEPWLRPLKAMKEGINLDPTLIVPDDKEVLAQARHDFGDMILTRNTPGALRHS